MIDYGLKDKVAIITGANNPQGIGATTALAFAKEGAKVVLGYKRLKRDFDKDKTCRNGVDRYFEANAENADAVESKLKEINADYLVIESDISDEGAVKGIYKSIDERYGGVDILVNNATKNEVIYKNFPEDYVSSGCTFFILFSFPSTENFPQEV
ncbi:MAG: SDR family NAD(P)-dependent oxidoreductase [Clostridia bacterium]|nr:SDR family NAD(P)-dependent oxidoreductase [Clostridia bacterium]